MLVKAYLYVVLVFLVINFYYRYFIVGFLYNFSDLSQIAVQIALIFGLFSYVFQKRLLDGKYWKIIFYLLALNLIGNFLLNLKQGSVYTSFGILELMIGAMGFLVLSAPAYLAVYSLSFEQKKSKKKK